MSHDIGAGLLARLLRISGLSSASTDHSCGIFSHPLLWPPSFTVSTYVALILKPPLSFKQTGTQIEMAASIASLQTAADEPLQ
jgi:hypothetical protein